jgi:hypothetical protein
LDHLIGCRQQRLRDGEAEGLGGLEVEDELELGRTPRSSRSLEAAAGLKMLGVLADPMMTTRADYQDAIAAGFGVTEYAPEGKAAQEAVALWGWVKKQARGASDVTQAAVNL